MPCFGELAVDCCPHIGPVPTREVESLKDVLRQGIGEGDGTDLHPLP